ncbi:MAG: hypothetical protein GY862_19720, partial [Gammaproteobacteria bacterium]|nr:hypothetical protein [Gammaproteobacteria bacterium]
MHINKQSLQQINDEYIESLPVESQQELCKRAVSDLKEARERLDMNPENSSVPPGSRAPWEKAPARSDSPEEGEDEELDEPVDDKLKNIAEDEEEQKEEPAAEAEGENSEKEQEKHNPPAEPKKKGGKPGKQKGAEGHGRELTLPVTGEVVHRAGECACCGESLPEDAPFKARTGLYVADVEMTEGRLGLELSHVKHLYGETECACGHKTHTEPGRCE